MKKAFKKTFQYLIFSTVLLIIIKLSDRLETDITPYILGVIILSVFVFFVYLFKEKKVIHNKK